MCRSLALTSKREKRRAGRSKNFFLSLLSSFRHGLIFHRKFLIGPFSTEFAHRGACRIKKKVICSTSQRHIMLTESAPTFFFGFSKRKRAQLEPLWLKIMAAFADYALHFSAQYTPKETSFLPLVSILRRFQQIPSTWVCLTYLGIAFYILMKALASFHFMSFGDKIHKYP